MSFRLTQQALNILIEKYNIKKSLILKIEKELNTLNFVRNSDDFLILMENIVITILKINEAKKSFSDTKDTLKIKMSLEDIMILEIARKYGKPVLRNYMIKERVKNLFSTVNMNFTEKEMNEYYLNQEWSKFEVTEETRNDVLNNPKRYSDCDFRIRNGMFRTEEEQEKYIQKSLKRKLP